MGIAEHHAEQFAMAVAGKAANAENFAWLQAE